MDDLPPAPDQALVFELVEHRIQRPLGDLEHPFRTLAKLHRDRIPVQWPLLEDGQNQPLQLPLEAQSCAYLEIICIEPRYVNPGQPAAMAAQ